MERGKQCAKDWVALEVAHIFPLAWTGDDLDVI